MLKINSAIAFTGLVMLAGEVKSNATIDADAIVRRVIRQVGYTKVEYGFDDYCGIINTMYQQSPDIDMGVTTDDIILQGAGDQGIMFGYANNETKECMPLAYVLANKLVQNLAKIRKEGKRMQYLRPDSKSQVTVEYGENGKIVRIDTILLSTQHDEFASDKAMQEKIKSDIEEILLPNTLSELGCEGMIDNNTKILVNPTGRFVIGGPHGDTGLTGRKIIVDTYGGYAPHGGGAFSGKDPSKVDRSAAYAARFIAKNLVANHIAQEILIQIAYAIGVAEPISVYCNGKGFSEGWDENKVSTFIKEAFHLTPNNIINGLSLLKPIYERTARYGHFGRPTYMEGYTEYFPWEKVMDINTIRL